MPLSPTTSSSLDFTSKLQNGYRVLLVKGSSDTRALAGVLIKAARQGEPVVARAIGAGAVNQAAKACAIAEKYGRSEGIRLTYSIEFTVIKVDNTVERSALNFIPHVDT